MFLTEDRQDANAQLSALSKHVPTLPQLLSADSTRYQRYHRRAGGLLFDYSRQRVTDEVMDALLHWAEARDVPAMRDALFAGGPVNKAEGRAALHSALRWPWDKPAISGSEHACEFAQAELARMERLVSQLQNHQWCGSAGEPITDVIHVGVGGSDLGPRLACQALTAYRVAPEQRLNVHFVSIMDGTELAPLLQTLDPARTLLVVASKSFTTVDTRFNVSTALEWMASALDKSVHEIKAHHVLGVSARGDRMTEWGLPEAHQLRMGEWVGGRFSLWSPIGFVVALELGMRGFKRLLAGAHAMDQHFLEAPLADNIPVLAALIGCWNTQYLGIATHAVLPYDGRLAYLPNYLQQLEMESNGKSRDAQGNALPHPTCPIVWGNVGPNGQHAFYQLIHQGSHNITADLLVALNRHEEADTELQPALQAQQRLTLSNCLAQARLMALGDGAVLDDENSSTNSAYRGNQPNTLLMVDALTPETLGQILALYEHKVFVQATLWGLNPFDQPGVELGKTLANGVYEALDGGAPLPEHIDPCTAGALGVIQARSGR